MTRRLLFQSASLILLLCVGPMPARCQKAISMEEALRVARTHHAALERDRLAAEQQRTLAGSGLLPQPAQIFLSGEEFGVNGQSGVHSINVQQNFYLPSAVAAQKAYYSQSASLAEKQMTLTGHELERQVKLAFYTLLYARKEHVLATENLALYSDFLAVTTAQHEAGETGIIPQLAARTRAGQAQLDEEHALEKYQIALTLFNQWLPSDTLYEAAGTLAGDTILPSAEILNTNPHLQVVEAQRELADAKIATQKALLQPQIYSGLQLQTAAGDFPLFGYQLGVQIPLFRGAYRDRITAAEIGLKVQEAGLRARKQELERTISALRYRLEHQIHILEYLEQELTPIVRAQSAVNQVAYTAGETGFLEYLDSLEQVVKVKLQYLEALYNYNVLRVELDYWAGL